MSGQAVSPDHHDSEAGWAQVFLSPAVDEVVGIPVDGPAQKV